jgi:hypothetical protein
MTDGNLLPREFKGGCTKKIEKETNICFRWRIFMNKCDIIEISFISIYGIIGVTLPVIAIIFALSYPICWGDNSLQLGGTILNNYDINSKMILLVYGGVNIIFLLFSFPILFTKVRNSLSKNNSTYEAFDKLVTNHYKVFTIISCLLCSMFLIFHIIWGYIIFDIADNSDCYETSFSNYVLLRVAVFPEVFNMGLCPVMIHKIIYVINK